MLPGASRIARAVALLMMTLSTSACCTELLTSVFGACAAPQGIVAEPTPSVAVTTTPGRVEIVPGGSATVSVSVTLGGGVTAAALSLGGSLPPGVSPSFTPPSASGTTTSTLTLAADASARAGLFVFDVIATATGTGAGTTGRATVNGEVLRPFTLVAPAPQTVTVGTSRELTIAITRASGFSGAVTFAVIPASVPVGTGVTFTPPVATSGSTTLLLDVPAGATIGRYLTRAIGSFGASADTVTWLLDVVAVPVPPDFTLVATPATRSVAPGDDAVFDLVMTRSVPGMGDINLDISGVPAGATATFVPASVPGTSAQLTVTTSAGTPDGTYPLTITGTAGTLVRETTVTLTVASPADFSIAVDPPSLTVARGASGQATITITRSGMPGDVILDVLSLPSGVTATVAPAAASGATATLTLNVGAAVPAGTHALTVRGVAGAITRTAPLSLTVPPPPAAGVTIELLTPEVTIAPGATALIPVRLTRTAAFAGQLLELRVAGVPPGGNAWVSPTFTTGDTATLQVIGGNVGTSSVTVTVVVGVVAPSATATVTVAASATPDFSLLPLPRELTMVRGMLTPMSVEIVRTNGFGGAVAFTAITDNPTNYLVTFTPVSTTTNSVQVSVYASPNIPFGAHVLVIRGTSGGVTREAVMTLHIRPPL